MAQTRSAVPVEETWNLDDLYPSVAAWEADLAVVEANLPVITAYQGRLGNGPDVLRACLEAQEALSERFTRAGTFAHLKAAEDGSNPTNQTYAAKVGMLSARVGSALAFVDTEILALPEGTIERYLAEDTGLAPFRRLLEDLLEQKPHILSSETETALATLEEVFDAPYVTYSLTKSSDIRFEPVVDSTGKSMPVTFAIYEEKFEESPDTAMRRRVYDSFAGGLKQYQSTFASTMATEIQKNVAMAKIRKYESAEHYLLAPQHVTHEAYTNLLDIIQADLAPHMRRLARLRKRVLGLDHLRYCDIKAPLDPEYRPSIEFGEARELIVDALAVFGEEHNAIMRTALTNRWVDLAENNGKSTGAFCSSPYGVHSFILVTWANSMRSAFVLAHELGHAGHFMLAGKAQRLVNTRPSMFFIETPSTLNELILGQHILAKSTDQRMRRWVLLQFLATYHHNYVTHLLEGELQRRLYTHAAEGRPINANLLNVEKGAILEGFWGDTVVVDDAARLTWMRQPHYYLGLYPYTYSAGLTASTAIAQSIREEGKPAVDRWISALKAGGTLRPLDLMKLAGVDFTSPAPIRKAVAYVGTLVDELERSFD